MKYFISIKTVTFLIAFVTKVNFPAPLSFEINEVSAVPKLAFTEWAEHSMRGGFV